MTTNPGDLDLAAVISKLETRTQRLMLEAREPFARTDATGSRSTSRRKTIAQHAAERARIAAYCDAIHMLTDDRTPTAVQLRLSDGLALTAETV